MPIKFRDLTRNRTIAAHRADDFGADRPYVNSGDYWTREQCDAMTASLIERGFRRDTQINVEPIARSILALARDTERLMIRFGDWYGQRNPIAIVEGGGPYPAVCDATERSWFEFFSAIAPVEADHGNHAHVVVTHELTFRDEYMLAKLGRKLGLKVNVSRNSEEWLAGKRGVTQHACKIAYTVKHLRRQGSDFRASGSQTPEWVRRARAA